MSSFLVKWENSMAGMYSKYCKMIALGFLQFILILTTLDTVCKIVEAVDGHSQAFIQTDNELRYLIDGVSIHLHESLTGGNLPISFTEIDEDSLHTFASPIVFEPPSLDFKEHPVGMPLMEKVVVVNPSATSNIHLLSISGSTTDFHCSFFKEKSIAPGGNTTFDVVFLGRQEGSVDNTLFIHTSLGSFKYQVRAVGLPNPYRLRPFLGVKMPLNSSYSPIIQMHNPYSSTLQVTEMYSSGGDLHLELPSGELEASQQLWEIPPFETKPVMRANFVARIESNHTAYIRIKTNSSNNDNLVLPLEVEVSSAFGIYSPIEVLDFGVMRSQDEVKSLTLNLINYGQKHIYIQNVIVTPVNEAITIEFQPVKVPPDTLHATQVAFVSFNPAKAVHSKQHAGKIVVKSKNTQFKLTIPYQVTMLHGSLGFNANTTKFYLGEQNSSTTIRNFTVVNNFNVSIVVHSIALPEEIRSFIKIHNFKALVVSPGQEAVVMQLELISSKAVSLTSFLRLLTNISFFDVPIVCYDGRLKKFILHALDRDRLDFGTMSIGEKRDVYFVVINENPVEVYLRRWGSNISRSFVELVGVDEGNLSTIAHKHNLSGMPRSLIVRPNHYAVFRLGVAAPEKQGLLIGEVFIETPFELIKIPVNLWSVQGSLNSDLIVFDSVFPGRISWKKLQIHSTFSQAMTVTSVDAQPQDVRLSYEPLKMSLPVLKPETKSLVGKLYFDPTKECMQDCYTGLPVNSLLGKRWLSGMAMPFDVGDIDSELYRSFRNKWDHIVSTGKQSLNITLQVNTNEVKGFALRAQANFLWPRLASKHKIKYPVTQIGNTTVREFALENPSGLPVITQVLLLPMYPGAPAIFDSLPIKFPDQTKNSLERVDLGIFTLQDTEDYNSDEHNPIPSYRNSIQDFFNVQPHQASIALVLTPGMRVRVRIGFSPTDELLRSSVVFIRNNLTVMDTVILEGYGGIGQIKFGNKKPGTLSPFMFEMTEKHLKDCDKMKATKHLLPNFTVKRAFTVRNPGELPVYVQGFAVNGSPCEGYGFKILNCQGFQLQPNASRKIDIAFTPDFTMSRIQRMLNIFTSLTPTGMVLNYSLVATIPLHLVSQCSSAIPRPEWEPLLYYSSISFMAFLMFCVLIAAYFESDRIFKYRFITMSTSAVPSSEQPYERSKVFDLKNMVFRSADIRNICHSEGNAEKEHAENKKRKEGSGHECNHHLLNFSQNFFKSKKVGQWPSSKPAFDQQQRDRDLCNNNLPVVPCKEAEPEADNHNGNKVINRKKLRRSSTHDSHGGEPTAERSRMNPLRGWSSLFQTSSSKKRHTAESSSKHNSKDNDTHNNTSNSEQTSNDQEHCDKSSKNKTRGRARTPTKQEPIDFKTNKKTKSPDTLEEDTSSTTTESSNTDVDITDKNKNQEIVPLPKPTKVKNLKVKPKVSSLERPSKSAAEPLDLIDDDDGEFELSTKSRAHRRVKIDHSKVYGGDILRPNTLELPYKLKTVPQTKEERGSKEMASSKKVTPSLKIKGITCVLSEAEEHKGKESPPPEWDQPRFANSDEAFSELSKQTELFAQNHGRPAIERPSSYSAIVSDGSKARSLPIGTFNSESRKNFKHPGTIGQRLSQKSSTSAVTPSWGTSLLSPATPQTPPESKPLFPSGLLHEPLSGLLPLDDGIDCNKSSGITSSLPFDGSGEPFSPGRLWEPHLFDAQQNVWREPPKPDSHKDWSRFGTDLLNSCPIDVPSNSLWDANYSPNPETWATKESLDFSPTSNSSNLLSHLGAATSPWPTSLWCPPVTTDFDSASTSSTGCGLRARHALDAHSPSCSPGINEDIHSSADDGSEKLVRGFDPFRTPHHIWSPAAPSNLGCDDDPPNWAFSFFSNKEGSTD